MDVAWMLSSGSTTGDWELRISMRSFWTNYLAPAQPWIIGHIPSWINRRRVKCIPWPDPYKNCKDANLLQKALRLALEPRLSDPFILCSDDQILLRPSLPADFKLWHRGEIEDDADSDSNKWQRRLARTARRLRSQGFPARNFDGHVPYPLRKEWITQALRFDFGAKHGMCLFSTILNCSGERAEPLDSQPVRGWLGNSGMDAGTVDAKLAVNQFACLNDYSLDNPWIIARLEQLFFQPAPWELDAAVWPRRSRKVVSLDSGACLFGAAQ